MALKSFNPITPSLRGTILIDRSDLWKGKPVKGLTEGKSHSGGRNNHGRITSRFRGGGHKQSYRIVDFKRRDKFGVPALVERLEYDPNRTAFIALLKYEDGELSYIIAPQRLKVGDTVVSAERADIKPGNAMPMAAIPVGTIIHNIEMKPGAGGKIARSAGTFAQLVGKDAGYAQVKLVSGELRLIRNAWRPLVQCPTRTIATRNLARRVVIVGLAASRITAV
jgi:large subunit ribosomal protein L2